MSSDTWREITVNKDSAFFGEMNNLRELGCFIRIDGSHGGSLKIDGFSASVVLNGVFYWPATVIPTYEFFFLCPSTWVIVFRKIGLSPCLDEAWDQTNWKIAELKGKIDVVICADDKFCDVLVLNEDHSS